MCMDSRSGPELAGLRSRACQRASTKVLRLPRAVQSPLERPQARFDRAQFQKPQCIRKGGGCARCLVILTALLLSIACEPDARNGEGGLARAGWAASRHDSEALFHALDQRERFAMAALVKAR